MLTAVAWQQSLAPCVQNHQVAMEQQWKLNEKKKSDKTSEGCHLTSVSFKRPSTNLRGALCFVSSNRTIEIVFQRIGDMMSMIGQRYSQVKCPNQNY